MTGNGGCGVPDDKFYLRHFSLGDINVHPSRACLSGPHGETKLEPRVMDVLCGLARHAGEVVSRDDLIEEIWKVEYGADESLTRAISVLRKSFRAQGVTDKTIETIPKRGYRLLLPVEFRDDEGAASNVPVQDISGVEPVERLSAPDIEQWSEYSQPRAMRVSSAADGSTRHILASGKMKRAWLVFGAIGIALFVILTLTLSKVRNDSNGSPVFVKNDLTGETIETVSVKSTSAIPQNSIAVLPFIPLSDAQNDEYFGDGITEELLNSLARLSDLSVAARTSSFSYKGKNIDIREIGQQLRVAHVLEGSVRRVDDTLRVTAQLIRASDGFHLWSEVYERDLQDVFAIQDDIVREISNALQIRLGVGKGAAIKVPHNIHPEAIERYYEGLHLWGNRMRKDGAFAAGYDALRAAVEIDPQFADAWAALGFIGSVMAGGPLARDREGLTDATNQAFRRALGLNDQNYMTHAGLVIWHALSELNIAKAKEHLAQAEAFGPNAAETIYATALYHWVTGDARTAIAFYDRALRLDPLNITGEGARAIRLAELGKFREAFEFLNACQEENCLGEGFIAFATTAAIFSGDETLLAYWQPINEEFEAFVASIPDSQKPIVARIMPAFFSIRLNRADKEEQIAFIRTLFSQELITDSVGIWGPTFADILPQETFMDVLHLAYERKDLFSSTYGFSPFYGVNPYPEWVLRHPRYHALWQRPGMMELANARRKNGMVEGLPLAMQ